MERVSWFNQTHIASHFALWNEKNVELIESEPKNTHCLLDYIKGSTSNFLPTYGYPNMNAESLSTGKGQRAIEEILVERKCTTAFINIQGVHDSDEHKILCANSNYVDRNPSYLIDLSQSNEELRKNVSRRRRSKLIAKIEENIEFSTDKFQLADFFVTHYLPTMVRLNAHNRFVFDQRFLRSLCDMESVHLLGVKKNGIVEMVLLHGIYEGHAEFVFSSSTEAGQDLSTYALWQSIKYFKSLQAKSFHLGGGIKAGDGLEDFKRQLGGLKLFNGGLKYIINPDPYRAELINSNCLERENNFFPAYLEDEILGLEE